MSARAFLVLLLCAGMAMVTHAKAAECGEASWYSQGRVTASGERYNPDGISAAHPSLPFGSRVVVRDMASGRSVTVRISDRGPARWTHRIIDLSRGAARRLGMIGRGVIRVCLTRQ